MADINIGSDQLLTTTLSDNDRLTFTRAETGQQIATMTVGNFRKNTAIDYTSLTERIVPGEFWASPNSSTKKQVYIRTFIGVLGSTKRLVLATGIDSANVERSCILNTSGQKVEIGYITRVYQGAINEVYGTSLVSALATAEGELILIWGNAGELADNTPFSITFKYTKA